MKLLQKKSIPGLFAFWFFTLQFTNPVAAQCDNSMCTMKSDIRAVRVMGYSPGKVTIGKKSQIVIEAKNSGTCSWITGTVFMRVTVVSIPSGSSATSYQRDEMVPNEDIKINSKTDPGDDHPFIYDIEIDDNKKIPTGKYSLKFTMVCKGKPFGEVYTDEIEVVDPSELSGPCKLAAELGATDVKIPAKVMAGKKYPVTISAKNVSNCDWEAPKQKIALKITCLSWPAGASNNEIVSFLTPGRQLLPEQTTEIRRLEMADFEYDLTGSPVAGNYVLEFQLTDNGKPFGPRCQKRVEVTGDPRKCDPDASINIFSLPSQMTYNKEYPISIKVQNSGVCEWVNASRVELRCKVVKKPTGSPSQPPVLVPDYGIYPIANSSTVAPGKWVELRFKLKGPYMPGTYELEWELFKEGSGTGIKVKESFTVVIPK